jgi:predicted ATPase
MARLDRLALPVKAVAQIGAAIGREFSHDLLAAVSPLPGDKLGEVLDQLVRSELVFRRGAPPQATYSFKHALVQDAAYQSLLKSKRQQLHARIAQVLEQRLPDAAETAPEVLARHLTEAGLTERAILYWRRAGELAAARSANVEAIAHLNKGLDIVATLPNSPQHLNEELALLLAIGGPLMTTKGFAAPEVERTYGRASALCHQMDRSAELFPALKGLWNCYFVRGELQRAHDLAATLVKIAEEQDDIRRGLARRTLAGTEFFLGRFADAAATANEAVAIDDAVAAWDDPAPLVLYNERAAVLGRLYSAWAKWYLGFPDSALQKIEAGLAVAQRLEHASSIAFALIWAAALHNFRRDFDLARRRAEAAVEIAREHRMSAWLGHATVCGGFAMVGLGHQAEGIAQIRSGLAFWHATGGRVNDTQWIGFLAESHLQAGQFTDSLKMLDLAAETAAANGECHYQAELHRLRGTVLAKTGEQAEAASWLKQAIKIARSQQARSLELRSATSLARLWADQGKRIEGHELLAPVYDWFTEGFETPDLRDAKALLNELS